MSWFAAEAPLFPEIIALHGKWQGERPAVVDGARVASWREFDAGTNRVANALIAIGVRRGDRVAVLMRNSLEMLEAIWGILKAGGVVVPLNLSITDDAVAAMIQDSASVAVLASDDQCARVKARRPELTGLLADGCIGLDAQPAVPRWLEYRAWRDAQAASAPRVTIGDEDECNIIYSSGTTGLPKGIVHTHRRRLDWAYDLAIALRYHCGARTLCSLGLYSNISWVGFLCTMLAGGTVVVLRAFEPRELMEVVQRERVTHGAMVPLQFRRILEHPEFEGYDLASLRSLMCCGSPLPAGLKAEVIRRLGCELIELYGLTEGVITTLAPEDVERKLASVGKPLPGTDLRILDSDDRDVPAGESGEIVGRGRFVMSGYHGRPDSNAEATWTDEEGRRWLRTGDIGRLDDEGFLYIVDRKKDMILSGGQNIYPADIESVMQMHPDVAEVAVVGVSSERWGETPLALVVPRAGTSPDAEAIAAWTNERVGKQQRVSAVTFRDSLPRNPNGKILRRELRAEYAGTASGRGRPS
jgi:acyl-CoA synthetase (AMP-forming)/AMP-acid ligase II